MSALFQMMLYFGQDFVEDYGTADVALDAYLNRNLDRKDPAGPVRSQRAFGQKLVRRRTRLLPHARTGLFVQYSCGWADAVTVA